MILEPVTPTWAENSEVCIGADGGGSRAFPYSEEGSTVSGNFELTTEATDELLWDPRVASAAIAVSADDGKALTLDGLIPGTVDAKVRAGYVTRTDSVNWQYRRDEADVVVSTDGTTAVTVKGIVRSWADDDEALDAGGRSVGTYYPEEKN
jgi:hypothetical protein